MAPVFVDPARVHAFADAIAFETWLATHHDREPEVWIKIRKLKSGLASITPKEAIDVALCWGWIDAIQEPGRDQLPATLHPARPHKRFGAKSISTTSPA